MVGLEIGQVGLGNYFKSYLEYINKQKNSDELPEYVLEFCDLDGYEELLSNFNKLTKKIQIQLIVIIRKLGLSVLSKKLNSLVFIDENKVKDPFLKTLIIDTIKEISDERYNLWLEPILRIEKDLEKFIDILCTLNHVNIDQSISIFRTFVTFDSATRRKYRQSFKKVFLELIRSSNLIESLGELCIDSNKFKNLFLSIDLTGGKDLFSKIMIELVPVSKKMKSSFLNVLQTKSHELYSFIVKNKQEFNFSDPIMICIKSFDKGSVKSFSENYIKFLEEEKIISKLLQEFIEIVIEIDTHQIEDKLMDEIDVEVEKNSCDRDLDIVIGNALLLLHKDRMINTIFEQKIFKILLTEIQSEHMIIYPLLEYMKRNRLKPSEKIIDLAFSCTDPVILMNFIDYFSELSEEKHIEKNKFQQIDDFVKNSVLPIFDGKYLDVIFKYYLSRGEHQKSIVMLKDAFSRGSLEDRNNFLEVLDKKNVIEVSSQFKEFLCEIINMPSISKKVKGNASSIIIDIMEKEELIDFIKSLNSLSSTIFFESLINKCSTKTLFDVLTSFLDSEKLVVRNYIFNNLKRIFGCKVEKKIIDKLIIHVFESSLFCFDVIVFMLNNECDLTEYREKLEEKFQKIENPFNRVFLALLLKKSFKYKDQLDEFRSKFEESDVSDEQLEDLYRLSSVVVFKKEFCNYFLKVHQKNIKLMILRNMALNHIPEMFNQLLTSLRLESQFTLQKKMISMIGINFTKNQIRPLINVMNLGKRELNMEIFKLFLTFPVDFIIRLLEDEINESAKSSHDVKYVNKVKWVIDKVIALNNQNENVNK